MRKLSDVIAQISALIPNPAPPAVADDLTVLAAELTILNRVSLYTAPESPIAAENWARLGTALYRYLPNPAGYAWAQAISDVVTK